MKLLRNIIPFLCLAPMGFAQLTQDQKVSDFMQLVGLYAKNYGPYQEKRDVFNFDLYKIDPWLAQVQQSQSDLDFYDICTRYVASLQDSHDEFTIWSDFDAWLHFDGDIYDGKFLIDYIDYGYLPADAYRFTIGDELVSVDGVAIGDLLSQLSPYAVNGSSNPVSRARIAAAMATERYQGWYPHATNIGANATIVVKQQDGKTATYTIPWDVLGTAVASEGPVQSPNVSASASLRKNMNHKRGVSAARALADPERTLNPWRLWSGVRPAMVEEQQPKYMAALNKLQNMRAVKSPFVTDGLEPFGNFAPAFNPPAGFKLRLGAAQTDEFVSGTFPLAKLNIGYIRIPSMEPSSRSAALKQFAGEVAYFQANTDGIIVDVMGNGGGNGCYSQDLASYLIPHNFRGLEEEIRATLSWQVAFSESLVGAELEGAPDWVIGLYRSHLNAIKKALASNRGNTGSLAICGPTFDTPPATDNSGKVVAYTKPILVLVDNFTLSAAEVFTMFMQDSKRATIFGTRTDGGGGNVVSFDAGAYSEGNTRVTEGLITRAAPVQTPGFPSLASYDGVGIYPDIVQDL
ncbi:MAG TPA: S41 family peptidase, partial [Bryobacteraceae bacterium]|nr:S41 family peptidase [Bryobacteraceae bacterium]